MEIDSSASVGVNVLVHVSPDPENVEQLPPEHVAVGVDASDSDAVKVTM